MVKQGHERCDLKSSSQMFYMLLIVQFLQDDDELCRKTVSWSFPFCVAYIILYCELLVFNNLCEMFVL